MFAISITQGRLCIYIQVYLVDYGLATKYVPDGKHKEYKEEPKKAHDGTVEFTSIDAHKGVGKHVLSHIHASSISVPQIHLCIF